VAFLVASMVATAPFAGTLSEKSEKLARGDAPTQHGLGPIVREAVRSTLHTLVSVTIYLTCAIVLFFLQFFVSVLAPFIWVASLFLSGTFLAYDAFDLPLSRRDAKFGRKWAYIGEHTAEALGFGVVVALLIAVPGLNLIVPAIAAVGGTLLFLDLERS
jgi:CysZ protein